MCLHDVSNISKHRKGTLTSGVGQGKTRDDDKLPLNFNYQEGKKLKPTLINIA